MGMSFSLGWISVRQTIPALADLPEDDGEAERVLTPSPHAETQDPAAPPSSQQGCRRPSRRDYQSLPADSSDADSE